MSNKPVRTLEEIVEAKEQRGEDCTEDESARIKAHFTTHHPLMGDPFTDRLAELFPCESDEWQADVEDGRLEYHGPPLETQHVVDEPTAQFFIQRRVGDGPWEEHGGYRVTTTLDEAKKVLRSAENSLYSTMEDVFSNVKTPAEARAAADRHEQLQATELRLAKREVGPAEVVTV